MCRNPGRPNNGNTMGGDSLVLEKQWNTLVMCFRWSKSKGFVNLYYWRMVITLSLPSFVGKAIQVLTFKQNMLYHLL